MRVGEVANVWGVSVRQVYRLIESGDLPATRKPRDRPVEGYEVEPEVVSSVFRKLQSLTDAPKTGVIKKILRGEL
jgi:excisionase family DNA binding protein